MAVGRAWVRGLLAAAVAAGVARAGDEKPPSVRIDLPAAPDVATPLPVVDLRGVVTGADRCTVSIETKERTLSFEAKTGVTIAMTVDVARAIASGKVGAKEKPEAIREETAAAIRTRLRRLGAQGAAVESSPDGLLVARLAASDDALLLDAARFVPMQSSLEFRLQVLPAERMQDDVEGPQRRTWTGTEADFDAFLASEVKRWTKADEARQPYIPSNPRWRVVPRKGSPRATPDDFAIVEEPAEDRFRFDGSLIEESHAGEDERGSPVVSFRIRDARQEALRAFTGANIHQRMGILIDGELWSAPRVNSVLSDAVQITLGVGSPETLRLEAERLAVGLSPPFVRAAAAIVAVVERASDGTFEAFGPLAPSGPVVWTLRSTSSANATAAASRRFVHAPSAPAPAPERVAAQLARVKLGMVDADDAAADLLRDATAAGPVLLADLRGSPFAANRIAAARVARRFAPEVALEPLLAALDDPRPAVRVAAVRSIARMGPTAAIAVPKLLDLYVDGQGVVREASRAALEAIGKDAVPALTEALANEEAVVRRAAVEVLSLRYEPEVAKLVLARLEDDDDFVRTAVAIRFSALMMTAGDDPEVPAILARALRKDRTLALPELAPLWPERVPEPVLSLLREWVRDPDDRTTGLLWLATFRSAASAAADDVRAALGDPNFHVRGIAAQTLHALTGETEEPVRVLVALLRDESASARAVAAWNLGELGSAGSAAVPDLAASLGDPDPDVRTVSAVALFRMGHPQPAAREVLEAARKDPKHAFRGLADETLREEDAPK